MSGETIQILGGLLWTSTKETLVMVGISLILSELAGLPLGIALMTTGKGQVWENSPVNKFLDTLVNVTRSIPFIILLVAIIPLTRIIVGTSIGTAAATVPLTLAAIPFVARMVEASLREVDRGVIEAAQSMGATGLQVVTKVLLPEAFPSLASGATITAISLVGYSAMAGAVGGGGLGDLAIRYGYQRFQTDVMIATVVVLIIGVHLLQYLGDFLTRRLSKTR